MKLAGAWCFALLLLGCGPANDFSVRPHPLRERELFDTAALIVVATQSSTKTLGQSRTIRLPETLGGHTTIELVEVRLKIEETIRGTAPKQELSVLVWTARNPPYPPGVGVWPGQRAIHYLVQDGLHLRYATDIFRSSTYVGDVRTVGRSAGESDAARAADFLLSPPVNAGSESFALSLSTKVGQSLFLIGFQETWPRLEALRRDPDPAVSISACLALYHYGFFGQDSCIAALSQRVLPTSPSSLRSELTQAATMRQSSIARFKKRFLEDPIAAARDYRTLPGEDGWQDFLRMMVRHPDREIASRASAALPRP